MLEKSVIELYLWPDIKTMNKIELYPTANFDNENFDEMFNSKFFQQCLSEIDHSKYLGNSAIENEVLGVQPITKISGGLKTILMAMRYRELRFPINNCGDNCDKAIYLSGVGKPTKWYWIGYTPRLLDDQIVRLPELNLETTGKDVDLFMMDGIPHELTVTGRAQLRKAAGLCAY